MNEGTAPTTLESLQSDIIRANLTDAEKRLGYADQFSREGLKCLFLVNGGSIISLFTLIGTGNVHPNATGIFWSFVWFTLGLAFNMLAYFGAYFCQNLFMLYSSDIAWNLKFEAVNLQKNHNTDKHLKMGNKVIFVAIFFAVLSFAFFVCGAFVALYAVT